MRIISPKLLRLFWEKHAGAQAAMQAWLKKVEGGRWIRFEDVRKTFRSVDQVTLPSVKSRSDSGHVLRKKTVVIFNVGGNNFRVIASINYKTGIVYTLFVLTHAEYDTEAWKKQL